MTPDERVGALARRSPALVRLAEEVSLAVLVDPALLRSARLALGRAADAGTEADLWFSPLVRSRSLDGFVLVPELAESLRRRLAGDGARLERARRRVEAAHAHLAPALRLEEELLYLSVLDGADATERIERALGSAAAALVREGRAGIAHWAARALPSLPVSVRETRPGSLLRAGAALRMGRDARVLAGLPPGDAPAEWGAFLLPPDFPRRKVRVRLLAGGLEVDARDAPSGDGHELELPATTPLLVDVAWGDGGGPPERVAVRPDEVRTVRGPAAGGVELRTLAGRFRLSPSAADLLRVLMERDWGAAPVFVSYARDPDRDAALQLQKALGGPEAGLCHVDGGELAHGDRFPEATVDALFAARVVVVMADAAYSDRWYSLLEFRAIRTPFVRMLTRPNSFAQDWSEAIRGLVFATTRRGIDPMMMDRLPMHLLSRGWPLIEDREAVATQVLSELASSPPTLRERYAAAGEDADAVRTMLLEASRLPPPRQPGPVPFAPSTGFPASIGEAFVGRGDDLWRIHETLAEVIGMAPVCVLEGAGGIGKTRLALEYVHRFGTRHYPGGVFWINAEQDAELQLHDVLRALESDAPELSAVRQHPGGVAAAVGHAVRALPPAKPALFVVDNLPEPRPGEPPPALERWCPAAGDAPVLMTGRGHGVRVAWAPVRVLQVQTLDVDAAVQLLSTGGHKSSLLDGEWREIAEWVGRLPLALVLLHSLLRSGAFTSRGLLEMSRETSATEAIDSGMETMRASVPSGVLRGVTEALGASYERLTDEERQAARLLAWMAPEPVPEVVVNGFRIFSPQIRASLRSRSLVSEVRDGAGTYFGSMHRLLGDFLRGRSPDAKSEAAFVGVVLEGLLRESTGRGSEGGQVVRMCGPVIVGFARNVIAAGLLDVVMSQLHAAGVALVRWGFPEYAGELFQRIADALSADRGGDHPDTLSVLLNLAVTRSERGDLAGAQELLERVVETRRRALGSEHPDTLAAMSNLALAVGARGDRWRARDLTERVVEAQRRTLGGHHPAALQSMSNLAALRADLGDHYGALRLQEEVLDARRRSLGEEHPETLASMSNLALSLHAVGDLAQARALHERVVEGRRSLLGEEHPDTLAAMNNLAVTLRTLGDLRGSQALQQNVLRTRRSILGTEHLDTLVSMNNLGGLLREQGDLARARDLQERVLRVRRRVLGEHHPDTMASLTNLANTLAEMGELEEARELEEQALEAKRNVLGEAHPDTVISIDNLAATKASLGDTVGAQRLRDEARRLREQIFGPDPGSGPTGSQRADAPDVQRGREHFLE